MSIDTVELTDAYSDTLSATIGDNGSLYIDSNEDEDETQLAFHAAQADDVRGLRDLLSRWLGDSESGVVRASDVSFNEGILRVAAVNGKTVAFRYAKGGGSVIELRVLKPAEVKTAKGHQIVVGFDPDRDEPRSYRLDRIKGEVSVA